MKVTWVREALEDLWSVSGLLANPLIDELGLALDESDSFRRAMALREAILQAGQRVKQSSDPEVFHLLNVTYGLEGKRCHRHQYSAARATPQEVADELGWSIAEYETCLQTALLELESVLA
jgi:hypothetical protein